MSSDGASNGSDGQMLNMLLPDLCTVGNVFLQQRVA